MTWRAAHGTAARNGALVAVETAAPDELPVGVPAPARPAADRDARGRLVPGPGTTEQAREAALAKAEASKFRRLLGLVELPADHPFHGYLRLAREHREDHCAELAANVGGGRLSPGVVGVVASASLALAASRYLYDLGAQTGDPKLLGQAARIADQSRTALLTAHELCAREAKARPRPPAPWLLADPQSADDDQDDDEPDQGDQEAAAPDVGGATTGGET